MGNTVVERAINSVQGLFISKSIQESELERVQRWIQETLEATDLDRVLIAFRVLCFDWHRNHELYLRSIGRSIGGGAKTQKFMLRQRLRSLSGAVDFDFLDLLNSIDRAPRIARAANMGELRTLVYGTPESPALSASGNQFPQLDGSYVLQFCVVPFLETEARLRSALAAVAIERFRTRNKGRLPERLEELVPAFLWGLPVDPFDGQTLKYNRIERSGYRVYSVGIDGDNDGGLRAKNMFAGWPPVPEGDIEFMNDNF